MDTKSKRYRPQRGFTEIAIVFVILVLAGIAGAYYLGRGTNKPSPSSSPTSIQSSLSPKQDETANWKTYTHPILHFSFKYPAEILRPKFPDIDPKSPANVANKNVPYITQYGNERYKSSGLNGDLGIGGLEATDSKSEFDISGIGFTVLYLGNKDVSSLKDDFKLNPNFSIITLNGVKVGYTDDTKTPGGIPPGVSKSYFFKIGTDLLRVTSSADETAAQTEKEKVFRLLDEVAATIKVD